METKKMSPKTVEEALIRLVQGEEFYYHGRRIYYDKNLLNKGRSPFRVDNDTLDGFWQYFRAWQLEPEWYENLGEGVLAWVSNNDGPWLLRIVVKHRSGYAFPFVTSEQTVHSEAKPATREEVEKYFYKNNNELEGFNDN